MPDEAWDCHVHVFGPWSRYPLPAAAAYTPDEAPFDALLAEHARCGITHGVLVQAAAYGDDHGLVLDALAAGQGRYRAIALVDADAPDQRLAELHAAGVRGVRLGMMRHLGGKPDLAPMQALLARIRPYGWHALVHAELDDVEAVVPRIAGCGVPLVIDHMGRLDARREADTGLARLLALGALPDVWIKLSGADRITGGIDALTLALPVMRGLIQAMPDRLLWGSDWPHVNIRYPRPDPARLLALLREACGEDTTADRILRLNPQRLYA